MPSEQPIRFARHFVSRKIGRNRPQKDFFSSLLERRDSLNAIMTDPEMEIASVGNFEFRGESIYQRSCAHVNTKLIE
jgi:hypothetical protein